MGDAFVPIIEHSGAAGYLTNAYTEPLRNDALWNPVVEHGENLPAEQDVLVLLRCEHIRQEVIKATVR